MMNTLTSLHRQQFREDGYCLVRNLIPTAVVEPVRNRIMAMVENPPAWGKDDYWQAIDPARYQNPAGQALPSGIQAPAREEAVFRAMAGHPNLAAAMSELLGGSVQLSADQVGVKNGCIKEEQGGCSYYHQDSYYWHLAPELGCNCWIPMDTVGKDAIGLAVIPGSQKSWKLDEHERYYDDPAIGVVRGGKFTAFTRWRIPTQNVDFTKEVLVPMEPGDALFFTNYTWHRSEPNRTGRTMSFYAIAYKRTPPAAS
jgi:hypothetical protein